MEGPSLAVRQADERSEGTAQRREDRPTGAATSLLKHGASIEQPERGINQSAETRSDYESPSQLNPPRHASCLIT